MNRLLIRIWAGVYISLLCAATLLSILISLFFDTFFTDPAWYPIDRTIKLVQYIIDKTPTEEFDREKERLSVIINRKVDVYAHPYETIPVSTRQEFFRNMIVYGKTGDGHKRLFAPVHKGAFQVSIDPSARAYRIKFSPMLIFFSLVFLSAFAMIIGYLVVYPINRRLNILESTAEKIRLGDTSARIPHTSSDLIGNIEVYFNQMAEQIQSLLSSQRDRLMSFSKKFQAVISQMSDLMVHMSCDTHRSKIKSHSLKMVQIMDDLERITKEFLIDENSTVRACPRSTEAISSSGATARRNDHSSTQTADIRQILLRHPSHISSLSVLLSDMLKFAARPALGILIALAINHMIAVFISQIGYNYISFDPNWYPARTLPALVQRAVDITPKRELAKYLETLGSSLRRQIDLVPTENLPPLIGYVKIKTGNDIRYGTYKGRKVLFAPVLESPHTLIIDLAYNLYKPQPSFLLHASILPLEFILTVCGGILLSVPIIRNLKKLEAGIEQVRKGALKTRVMIPPAKPVGNLARCFNEMTAHIQGLLDHRKNLVRAIAHEVRTPVSRIHFDLEILEESKDKDIILQHIKSISEEVGELNLLSTELQTLATLDTLDVKQTYSSFKIHDLLDNMATYYHQLYPHLSIVLVNERKDDVFIHAHQIYFKRAIQNILANASKYARDKVTVVYRRSKGNDIIEISDDGPGIPVDLSQAVFEPFTRLDHSRNRESGGFGLGLAIVRHILTLHKGTVEIYENKPRGTKVRTCWPSAKSSYPQACYKADTIRDKT